MSAKEKERVWEINILRKKGNIIKREKSARENIVNEKKSIFNHSNIFTDRLIVELERKFEELNV